MPSVTISNDKGLVQAGGSGVTVQSALIVGSSLDHNGRKTDVQVLTTGTIAVTAGENYDLAFAQPAGTTLKELILIPAGNIVTAGGSGDDVDISMGADSSYTDLLAATALMDDGGAAVTWVANTPLHVIENSHGHAANQFVAGVGPFGGPATTEAITPAATLYSSAARTVNVRFTPISNDLATAATTIKAIAVFLYH